MSEDVAITLARSMLSKESWGILPSGVFDLDDPIVISGHYGRLEGEGKERTILHPTGDFPAVVVKSEGLSVREVTIQSFSIRRPHVGIEIMRGGAGTVIEDVFFDRVSDVGVAGAGCIGLRVTRSRFVGLRSQSPTGVRLGTGDRRGTSSEIDRCLFSGFDTAIEFAEVSSSCVHRNIIENNRVGIACYGTRSTHIRENHFEGNDLCHVWLDRRIVDDEDTGICFWPVIENNWGVHRDHAVVDHCSWSPRVENNRWQMVAP